MLKHLAGLIGGTRRTDTAEGDPQDEGSAAGPLLQPDQSAAEQVFEADEDPGPEAETGADPDTIADPAEADIEPQVAELTPVREQPAPTTPVQPAVAATPALVNPPSPLPAAPPPGTIDVFALRSGVGADVEHPIAGEDLFFPAFERTWREPVAPPTDVAFMFTVEARRIAAVEMALLSLLQVYPALASPILVVTEEEVPAYVRRRFGRWYAHLQFVVPAEGWASRFPNIRGEDVRQQLTLFALSITDHERLVVLQPDALVVGDISEAWTGEGIALGYDVSDGGFVQRSTLTGDFVYATAILSLPADMRGEEGVAAMSAILVNRAGSCKVLDKRRVQRAWNMFARNHAKTVLPLRCCLSAMYVLKCLDGSRQGVCLLHDNGEEPWLASGGK